MRRITRLPHSQDITDYIQESITIAQSYLDSNEPIPDSIKSRYNYSPLKEILIRESSGKCVYCESKILSSQFGEIDHIIPKEKLVVEKNAKDIFSHDNLALSCTICNNKKRNNGQTQPILSPYKNRPERNLYYFGPMIFSATDAGRKFILIMGLDERGDLLTKIARRLRDLESLIRDYRRETDEEVKAVLKKRIIREASSDKEYSLAVFNFLQHTGIV